MSVGALALGMSSCENKDKAFPDYDGGTNVYFAYQYPIRTIILGDMTTMDNSMDNQHRFQIYATFGGTYKGRNIDVDVQVDKSLVDGLTFDNGDPVRVLPDSYYTLSSNTIRINGSHQGCIDVQLSDEFFNDPLSVGTNYVVPLVITNATGVDHIKTGTPNEEGTSPARQDKDSWNVAPMDYTLYLVNFINKYDGNYLRRGTDVITTSSGTTTEERKAEYVEYDEVIKATTRSLNSVVLPITNLKVGSSVVTCDILLTFDGSDQCTITSATSGYTVTGTGEFKTKSEKKAWGDKDRDGLYLHYTINLGSVQYKVEDILVARDRGEASSVREFAVSYNK